MLIKVYQINQELLLHYMLNMRYLVPVNNTIYIVLSKLLFDKTRTVILACTKDFKLS